MGYHNRWNHSFFKERLQIVQLRPSTEFRGWPRFEVYEGQYNLRSRTIKREVIPMTHDLDMAVTCWQPLSGALPSSSEEEIRIRIEGRFPLANIAP